jgi:FlaG/FlaF family flagellin (archaellin)
MRQALKCFPIGGFIYKIVLMPPNQPGQYDFILGSDQQPKRGIDFSQNKGARFAVIAVIVIIVIILAMVISSFLGKESKAQGQRLLEVAQAQTEIIRVTALGTKQEAKDLKTRNFALNTQLSVETSQIQVKKSLAAHGMGEKSISKKLGATKNAKTDAALKEATQNNRFDETFKTLLAKQLSDYQKLLKTASGSAKTKTEKNTLNTAYTNVGRLAPDLVASQ